VKFCLLFYRRFLLSSFSCNCICIRDILIAFVIFVFGVLSLSCQYLPSDFARKTPPSPS